MSLFITPLRNTTFTKTRADRAAEDSSQRKRLQHQSDEDSDDEIFTRIDDEFEAATIEDDEVEENEDDDELLAENARGPNPKAGKHRSLRYQHLDVLNTIVHKSILDQDWLRAERAYGLLLRCKGIDIRLCYDLGLTIFNNLDTSGKRSIEFLSRLIIAYPPLKARRGKRSFDRADTFVRFLAELRIHHGQFREAMQELDTWLLVPPYRDDRMLWQHLATCCAHFESIARQQNDRQEIKRIVSKKLKAEAKAQGSESIDVDDD